jgi:hypothetical protein
MRRTAHRAARAGRRAGCPVPASPQAHGDMERNRLQPLQRRGEIAFPHYLDPPARARVCPIRWAAGYSAWSSLGWAS